VTSEIKVYKRIFKGIRQHAAGHPHEFRLTKFLHKIKYPVLVRECRDGSWMVGEKLYPTKPRITPLTFFKDESTGLNFKLKFDHRTKKDQRICSECDADFKMSASAHRYQCSDECYEVHKEQDRKIRMDRNRLKKYEGLPAEEIPDGYCKICQVNISDKRAGALTCSDTCRKKYSRKKLLFIFPDSFEVQKSF